MAIEILVPSSRDEWLAERKRTVGGSETAALLDIHPTITRRELHAIKTGEIDRGIEEPRSAAIDTGIGILLHGDSGERGNLLEEPAIKFMNKRLPWHVASNEIPGGNFYRDLEIGLSATPDAFITDPNRKGFGICQIKNPAPRTFREKWGDPPQVPDYVAVQTLQEAFLVGASFAYVAAFIVSYEIDLYLFEIPLHSGAWSRLQREAADFWRGVREGKPPEFDFKRDADLVKQIYHDVTPTKEIDLSGKNDLPVLAIEDAKLASSMKQEDARRKEIKGRFLAELQDAEIGRYNGEVLVTAKLIRKTEHVVKAHAYRHVSLKTDDWESL